MFRQQKRCYDVMLSRQEGSTMCHLANAQWILPAGGNTEQIFLSLGGQSSHTTGGTSHGKRFYSVVEPPRKMPHIFRDLVFASRYRRYYSP